jgi:hypothetical protein
LNVAELEEDVMTVVNAAFTLVIAAAGIINDIAPVAINNNLRFELFLSLSNCCHLMIISSDYLKICSSYFSTIHIPLTSNIRYILLHLYSK